MDSLRNFKDFLQLYNQTTERCFCKCIESMNGRSLSSSEVDCVEKCATKFASYNYKLMMNFIKTQNELVAKRTREAELAMKEEENANRNDSNQEIAVN